MLINMKTLSAGPEGNRLPGKNYEVPDKEAKELIAGGYAVEAKREAAPERATARRGRERATNEAAEASAEE